VTSTGVIIPGYNGTPAGTCNDCESEYNGSLVTKPSVLHAELNCILKAAKEGVSLQNSEVYITLAPCLSCAAMLVQLGVKRVVYAEEYRDSSGIDFVYQNGIVVQQLEI